jgi:hypothetical protein
VELTTHVYLVPRLRMSGVINLLPPCTFVKCKGTVYIYIYIYIHTYTHTMMFQQMHQLVNTSRSQYSHLYMFPRIFNVVINCGLVVSFTPRPLYPSEKANGDHRIWGWMVLRACLNALEKRISCTCRESNLISVLASP